MPINEGETRRYQSENIVNARLSKIDYQIRQNICNTWGILARDSDFIKSLPVIYTSTGFQKNEIKCTDNCALEIPLHGQGLLLLGKITYKVDDYIFPWLVAQLLTSDYRGNEIITPPLLIDKHQDPLKILKRKESHTYTTDFPNNTIKILMANFQPTRDIDWSSVQNNSNPAIAKLIEIWK